MHQIAGSQCQARRTALPRSVLLKFTQDPPVLLYNSGHCNNAYRSESSTSKKLPLSVQGSNSSAALLDLQLCSVELHQQMQLSPHRTFHFHLPPVQPTTPGHGKANALICTAWCTETSLQFLLQPLLSLALNPSVLSAIPCRDWTYLKNKLEILQLSNQFWRWLSKLEMSSQRLYPFNYSCSTIFVSHWTGFLLMAPL